MMVDPLSLSVISAVAITEGIKFFYGQAGEILKRWRERKEATKDASTQMSKTEPIDVKLPTVFVGQMSSPQIHFDAVELLNEQLRGLRMDLADYADGIVLVDVKDAYLLKRVDALRQLLEAIYQQHLTFNGEQRPPSGPLVEGRIDVQRLAGYAAAIRAEKIISGSIIAEAKAESVEPGGKLLGLDVGTIGK